MEILKTSTPFQKIINLFFRGTAIQYKGNKWSVLYVNDPKISRFLKQINKIYAKDPQNEKPSPEDTLEEATALYRLTTIYPDENNSLEKIRNRLKVLYGHPPLWPSFHIPLMLSLEYIPSEESLRLTEEISTKLIYDYHISMIELFNLFPIPSEPLKLRIIKKYIRSSIDEKIHSLFWKLDFDPSVDDSAFYALEQSHYNEAVNDLVNSPYNLKKTSLLHLKFFFNELWCEDFKCSAPKIKLSKLKNIPPLEVQQTVKILCIAFFYSTKNQVEELIKKHRKELAPWQNWLDLFLLFTNQKKDDLKSIHEANQRRIECLKKLLGENWGPQSSLLKFLANTEPENFSKEALNNLENRLYWLTLVSFALMIGDAEERTIFSFMPALEEIACHPNQEQKNWAVSFCIFHGDEHNDFWNELSKMNIPILPALFTIQYISSHSSTKYLEQTKNHLRQILKCFFPKSHLHDRHYQRSFCHWIGQLYQLERLAEPKKRTLIKILASTTTREQLVKTMEAAQVLWNLKLFRELMSCRDHFSLVEYIQQLAPKRFGLEESLDFSPKFNLFINNFEHPEGLLIYYATLKSWGDHEHETKALELFRNFISSLVEGTFKELRYKNNPIINYLEKNNPAILFEWKKGTTYSSRDLLEKCPYFQKPLSLILKELINKGAFLQNGLQFDRFPYLYSYLYGNEKQLDTLKKAIEQLASDQTRTKNPIKKKILGDKRKLRIAEKLLLEGLENHEIDIKQTIRQLKEIYKYLLAGKAESEAHQLLKIITKYSLYESEKIFVHDSDDPQALFFSGKFHGSCQSIYSNAVLSCALLGYILNGNNRIIFVLDPKNEKVMIARGIFRFMFDENNNPVLLLEKIHYRCSKEEEGFYGILITEAAIKRAQELKMPLVTIGKENEDCWHSGLHIEDLFCPFDYSDAAVGDAFPSYDGVLKISSDRITCIYNPK